MVNLYYSLIAIQFICSGPCVPHRIKTTIREFSQGKPENKSSCFFGKKSSGMLILQCFERD